MVDKAILNRLHGNVQANPSEWNFRSRPLWVRS